MASVCKSSVGCVDSRVPVRSTYVNLHRWAESDAEFVRSVVEGEKNPRKLGPSPRVVDSYSCRQMYLRSYTFTKKESVPEKTRKCLGRVKERAADLPFIVHGRRNGSNTAASVSSFDSGNVKCKRNCSSKSKNIKSNDNKKSKNVKSNDDKKSKKGCVTAKKLREASCSVIRSILCHLLSCTTSVDVVDRRCPSP